MPRGAALGLGLGAAWGVLARIWMRLISDQPGFSWSGTLAIIGLSALLGTGVGLLHAARRSGRSGWWRLAVVPGLPLFMSPGMLFAPSFLLGGLVWSGRRRASRAVGWLALVAPVAAMTWLLREDPALADGADWSLVATFEVGFVAMAVSLAAAGTALWRGTPSASKGRALGADGRVGAVPGVYDGVVGQREQP